MKYLLKNLNSITTKTDKGHITLFLDYDGTLSPIAKSPDEANISPKMRNLLKKISDNKNFTLTIISGRNLKDLKQRVCLKNIIYCGNHGSQISGPKIKFIYPVQQQFKNVLKLIKKNLKAKLTSYKGILLEDKQLSLGVHYRLTKSDQIPLIKKLFHQIVSPYRKTGLIKIKTGKKVFEIRPAANWNKGKAVLWLLKQKPFKPDKPAQIIYIGDDTTDEDAFKVLHKRGITVFVGKPKKSYAEYFVRNTTDIFAFLMHLSANHT